MIRHISFLNSKLITHFERDNIALGLADGKMGFCIYLYYLSSIYTNIGYRKMAEKFLYDILKNIDIVNSIDIKSGLAGIGLGIDYIIKNNYAKGNINTILKDIDDVIFKNLSYSKYYEKIDLLDLIHILYYLCIRLKSQKQGSIDEYLFRELIIQTINYLYGRIDLDFYEEPLTYNIDYPLPQLLFLLSEVYNLKFYNYRLIKIIEELSHEILSISPLLHCNKLYFLWGMNILNKKIQDEIWGKHIQLISSEIDKNTILFEELGDEKIFFSDGFVSIYLMLSNLTHNFSEVSDNKNAILSKINKSKMWDLLTSDPRCFDKYKGMYSGYCGTIFFLELVKNDYI